MQHQSGRNIGRVDRAASRAASNQGLGLIKQGRGIVLPPHVVGDREDPKYFAQHSPVGPEASIQMSRTPKGRAGRD